MVGGEKRPGQALAEPVAPRFCGGSALLDKPAVAPNAAAERSEGDEPVRVEEHEGGVGRLADAPAAGTVEIAWLGQAGFALRYGDLFLLIDPYLSDRLAEKYRRSPLPHTRLMPPPIQATELRGVDWVLATHRHGDHMDPGTLPVVAAHNPRCRFVVPRAELDTALAMGLGRERIEPLDAEESLPLGPACSLVATASAHETLQTNALGQHHFLGYLLRLGPLVLYHSGDCVPYPGLVQRLRAGRVDLALLPVNGRGYGVPGNMTADEARGLCHAAGVAWMVPHHFGMFAFNTIEPSALERLSRRSADRPCCLVPSVDRHLVLTP
jgi:L-ascorbate metabolism protein UlaG (beta-lactamase superfamily)